MYQRFGDTKAGDVVGGRPCPVIKGSHSVMKAIDEMEVLETGALGVECDRRFVGIFTRSDFMKKVLQYNLNPRTTSLFEVMTFNPVVISPHETLQSAYKKMRKYRIRHLPVLENGVFRGILTDEDINIGLLENYENITQEYRNILSYIHGESYGRCAY